MMDAKRYQVLEGNTVEVQVRASEMDCREGLKWTRRRILGEEAVFVSGGCENDVNWIEHFHHFREWDRLVERAYHKDPLGVLKSLSLL